MEANEREIRKFYVVLTAFCTMFGVAVTILICLVIVLNSESSCEKRFYECRFGEGDLETAVTKAVVRIKELEDLCFYFSNELYITEGLFNNCSCNYEACALGMKVDCEDL